MTEKKENERAQPDSVFAVSFILCAISVTALMLGVPDGYWIAWRDLSISVSKGLGTLLGIAVTSNAEILTVDGFAMRIIRQCTASDYVVILALAILLYRRHSLSYRLIGVAIAVPTIIFANAIRLIVSGVVGAYSAKAFQITHDYFWVIGFALFVVALWTLWVNGSFIATRKSAVRSAQVVTVSIATYLILLLFYEEYGDLMARLSTLFYALLSQDTEGGIARSGDAIVYAKGGAVIKLNSLLEEVNVAIYLGLMAPLQKRGDWKMAATIVIGLACVVLMGAIFNALGCRFALNAGGGRFSGFWAIGSVVNLALPMTIYWILTGENER
jgi:Transmembrane exosortase (Exosortase_EpsH).